MKKVFRKEVIIGFCVLLTIAILVIGIDFLKGVNVFKAANYYYVSYENVNGLAVSAPVTINGFKVGQVRDIEYEYNNPGHVKVEISIDKELKLPRGTKAVLQTDLLGTASIALVLAPGVRDMHDVGETLVGEIPAGMMDNVAELLPSVQSIFPKADTLLTSLNDLVTDPSITSSLMHVNTLTKNLEASSVELQSIMRSFPPIVQNVNGITTNIQGLTNDAGRLVDDASAVTANLKQASSNVVTMTDDVTDITSRARQIPIEELVSDLKTTTDNLRQLSEQLNDPNSTLGLLMNDPELYRNINNAVSSLDSLMVDIRRNPKRYISIKLL